MITTQFRCKIFYTSYFFFTVLRALFSIISTFVEYYHRFVIFINVCVEWNSSFNHLSDGSLCYVKINDSLVIVDVSCKIIIILIGRQRFLQTTLENFNTQSFRLIYALKILFSSLGFYSTRLRNSISVEQKIDHPW